MNGDIQRKGVSNGLPARQGLYDPAFEHDACGVGLVANVDGRRTHEIVERGIEVLKNLMHRGATGSDDSTGDGAGILFQVPDEFFRARASELGFSLPPSGGYGVGMVFFPADKGARAVCREIFHAAAQKEGVPVLGWRVVPVDEAALGASARETAPHIEQCFLDAGKFRGNSLEQRLAIVRRQAQKRAAALPGGNEPFYIASLSARTIVYKGLMTAEQAPRFYRDLVEPDLFSAMALVHQRYSTNTFPSWTLAQPFRFLAHNGEINTLRGNLNAMRSRERNLVSSLFGEDIEKMLPVIEPDGSDSACLDNAAEILFHGGRELHHAMAMLIPQAWGQKYPIGPDLHGFYEYHAGIMEPWDGPAAVVFSDGIQAGAMLDRNGLRPVRYTLAGDGFIVLASEAGALDLPVERVSERGSLRPGEMLLLDLSRGHLMRNAEIKMRLARRRPYRRWVEENKISIHGFFSAISPVRVDADTLPAREKLFGYTREDRDIVISAMASDGREPVGSMGADQPPAALSGRQQLLYWHFKQLFAQITNPPIDPIREELVMSLMTFLGTSNQILDEGPRHARLVKLRHPILSNEDLDRLRSMRVKDFKSATFQMGFPASGGAKGLESALSGLCGGVEDAIREGGARLIVLSDRDLPRECAAIPALLAVSAVNSHLIDKGLRTPVSLLVETGEAREVMHIAALLGFGASAINPCLAFEVVADLVERGMLNPSLDVTTAMENYVGALCHGLLKIMSKMGISTLRSYRGAQVFEAVGLAGEVTERYFHGLSSRIGGIGLAEIAEDAAMRHAASVKGGRGAILDSGGMYKFRADGESRRWNPRTIALLQRAVRENNRDYFDEFSRAANEAGDSQYSIRALFSFEKGTPVPLDEVEPVEYLCRRFVTGAMSFGSISREAHETLAAAMNSLGCMSNSGEGGEDPLRYAPAPDGANRCSATKQVASGRFGVTLEYLVSARELQIKIAQGAKPGEGGQLPGHKVNAEIARVRHSTPGVTLISPPPHHDIYSIEDIAQLIYDLKRVNPAARVSVKLVSEPGVGTVAAGVAKAGADMILISGYDGGTGAAPLSSIRHAGLPWEMGLAETQQTLLLNGLRGRVRLQVDGRLMTGRDVVIASLLGADEFGFATAALICLGCVMMRQCHNNTCPAGIATQNPELRKRFAGKPEHVVNFFHMLADDTRRLMAQIGFRRFEEMTGRVEFLSFDPRKAHGRARLLDLAKLLHPARAAKTEAEPRARAPRIPASEPLDDRALPPIEAALEKRDKFAAEYAVRNVNRAIGAAISGRLARVYGANGLADGQVTLKFKGSAGQSFGAFGIKGLELILEGEANDYLGKGLSGARIVVKPPAGAGFDASANIIAGNVLLYGATAGEVYLNGRVGERFAVRNSGAVAVVEGVGDHGCEYMTGGRVAILGPTGVNFAAGMSGGIAYVLDETGLFDSRCNLETVDLERVADAGDERELKEMLEAHLRFTGSAMAGRVLREWEKYLPLFVKAFPMEYRQALGQMPREDTETERAEKGFE